MFGKMSGWKRRHRLSGFLAVCLTQIAFSASAEDLKFRKHDVNDQSEFEAASAFDVDNDGDLDIVSGAFWYEAPEWKKHDVRDVVRAYRLLVVHGSPGEAYNVCTGRDLAIGELAERMVALATRPMRIEPDPALQRRVETPVLRGDPSKLRRTTGWA